ncbi:glutamate receptor 2-like [Lytechinus pictus]|uniref:glutamate receptor 2-like n=1 Tax=Lytechinus pictus TaxID=7653 RepID=UPI0030B9FA9B
MAGRISHVLVVVCMGTLFRTCCSSGSSTIMVGAIFDRYLDFGFERGIISHNTQKNKSNSFQFMALELPALLEDTFNVTRRLCTLYSQNTLITGGHSKQVCLPTLQSYANYFLIPYVTASQSKSDMGLTISSSDYLVSMMPSLVPPVEDCVRYFKWDKFAYVYSSQEGLQRYQTLSSRFPSKQYDITVRRVGSEPETRMLLKSFRDSGRHRIIFDTTGNDTQLVLRQAGMLGMITSSYHYLFLDLDLADVNMDDFIFGGMNVTGFQLVNKTDPHYKSLEMMWYKRQAYLRQGNQTFDWPQNISTLGYQKLKTMTALSYDVTRVFWETISMLKKNKRIQLLTVRAARSCGNPGFKKIPQDKDVLEYIKLISFKSATGHIEFDENGERANYTLKVLALKPTGLQEVGTWMPNVPNNSNNNNSPLLSRLVLKGENSESSFQNVNKTFIITSVLERPFMMLKNEKTRTPGNGRYEGYCMDLLHAINEHHPFKFIIRVRNDSAYGTADDNGTWNGMVSELINKEADIAVAPLTINSDRERVIDFTKPYMSLGVSIMIKKPQNTRPSVFSFMHPLSYEIWLSIIFAYLGVSVVLFLVSRFSPDEWYTVEQGTLSSAPSTEGEIDRDEPRDKKANNFGIQNSLWFSMGALMQQGCEVSPRCLSGRIVGGVWWFFTLIIISSYTANLAAFLTVERMSFPINSAEDLVKRKDISYGIQRGGSTQSFFSTSKIPLYNTMWRSMSNNNTLPSPMTNSSVQGIERVRHSNGKYAFLLESTMNEYQNQQKPCDTMKVGSNLDSKSYGIGVARDLTLLRDELTLAILQLGEDGVLDNLKKKWWYDKGECDPQSQAMDQASALSLSNVAGIFYILVVGMGVAIGVALTEFYWRTRSQSNKEKISLSNALKAKIRMSVTGEKGMPTYPIMRQVNTMACEKALLSKDRESPSAIRRGQTSV